jgi:hypothetical protein
MKIVKPLLVWLGVYGALGFFAAAQTVQVDITPAHVVNTFRPLYALG